MKKKRDEPSLPNRERAAAVKRRSDAVGQRDREAEGDREMRDDGMVEQRWNRAVKRVAVKSTARVESSKGGNGEIAGGAGAAAWVRAREGRNGAEPRLCVRSVDGKCDGDARGSQQQRRWRNGDAEQMAARRSGEADDAAESQPWTAALNQEGDGDGKTRRRTREEERKREGVAAARPTATA